MSLTRKAKERAVQVFITATGIFLALRFNDFLSRVLDSILPVGDGLFGRFVSLVIVSIIIVYSNAYVITKVR